MTPEQMRVVIAEELGWTKCFTNDAGISYGTSPEGEILCIVPNYPEDLNACHEMEKVLLNDQERVGNDMNNKNYGCYSRYISLLNDMFCHIYGGAVTATAPQRCEAFIKTRCLERWIDMSNCLHYACRNCDHEFELEIDYIPAVIGRLFGPPENCHPDEPANVSVIDPLYCPKCDEKVNEDKAREDFLETIEDDKDYDRER